jgi:hypothetical protein
LKRIIRFSNLTFFFARAKRTKFNRRHKKNHSQKQLKTKPIFLKQRVTYSSNIIFSSQLTRRLCRVPNRIETYQPKANISQTTKNQTIQPKTSFKNKQKQTQSSWNKSYRIHKTSNLKANYKASILINNVVMNLSTTAIERNSTKIFDSQKPKTENKSKSFF